MTHTDKPDSAELNDEFELPPPDRLQGHYRRQLSAMLDGELSADEGRFMHRRLEHDAGLAACRGRWQACGNVLRGQPVALLPVDFADRVMAALREDDADRACTAAPRSKRLQAPRWAGRLALAASVAVVALFFGRQMPGRDDPAPSADARMVVEGSSGAPSVQPAMPAPQPNDDAGAGLAMAATTVAAAGAPVVSRSRRQSQRAAMHARARSSGRAVASTPALPVAVGGGLFSASDPFLSQPVAQSRPWPRAALPAAGSSPFAAAYAEPGAGSPFHAFAPVVLELPGHGPSGSAPDPGLPDTAAEGAGSNAGTEGGESG